MPEKCEERDCYSIAIHEGNCGTLKTWKVNMTQVVIESEEPVKLVAPTSMAELQVHDLVWEAIILTTTTNLRTWSSMVQRRTRKKLLRRLAAECWYLVCPVSSVVVG
jgi:hypothetical protein